jgi:hypothetical protein
VSHGRSDFGANGQLDTNCPSGPPQAILDSPITSTIKFQTMRAVAQIYNREERWVRMGGMEQNKVDVAASFSPIRSGLSDFYRAKI